VKKALIILIVSFAACKPADKRAEAPVKVSSPETYVEWVESKDNGLTVDKTISEYTFEVQYNSSEYLALQNLKKENVTAEELRKEKEELEGLQYYTLRIKSGKNVDLLKAGIHREQEYHERIDYFSFRMQKDLTLVDGKDTLKCVLFHFVRNYGIKPYSDFMLAFEKGAGTGDKTLIYEDEILGVGTIKIRIQAEDISRIPELVLNK
jgi:hypothetical protein